MPDSTEKQIKAALVARMKRILTASGFNTDVGRHIYTDRLTLDATADSLPAALVFQLEEEPEPLTSQRWRNRITYAVEVYANDVDMSDLLADFKQAVFDPADSTIGGLAHHVGYSGSTRINAESGSNGDGILIQVWAEYDEDYGNPY